MIYVVTASAQVYHDFCRRRDLDPRDQTQVVCIATRDRARGYKPAAKDEIHLCHQGDGFAYNELKVRQQDSLHDSRRGAQ